MLLVKEWVLGKDPNCVVDIACSNKDVNAEDSCMCCLIKDIPAMYGDLYVFTEQKATMKEALYARDDFRQAHQNSEVIYLVDLQKQVTIEDLALIFSKWTSEEEERSIACHRLIVFFWNNGHHIKDTLVPLTDEQLKWIFSEEIKEEIEDEIDRAIRAEKAKKAREAKKNESCFDELDRLLKKK